MNHIVPQEMFSTRKLILIGLSILLVTVGGFLVWSMSMPLSSASVAPGSLVVESKRKQIQHLQGGWVKKVFVKEGQQVTVSQPLIELSDTKAEAEYRRYLYRSYSLLAQQARLNALTSNQSEIVWSETLTAEQDELIIAALLRSEMVQFEQAQLRRQLLEGQYQQRIALYNEKIKGNQFQKRAIVTQGDLVQQEVAMTKGLVDKGYVSKTRMLELLRHQARVEAELAEISLTIDLAGRELEALHQAHQNQLLELKREYSFQLKGVNDELRDVQQLIKTALDIRERILIRSEFDGKVVGMNIANIGGVIKPGQVLMEIVPDSDELIVEAIVSPKDIDVVRPGLDARVRLTAYSARNTPPVMGEVLHVSADRVLQGGDSNDATQGYLVTIRFESSSVANLVENHGVDLYPGMLTEVLILGEERTLWDYLVSPILNGLQKAMREV
ncbi:putative type I secretion protein, HlyD family [Vibrio ichthyoenteri ATCC 700023]|uniref:Membrane fusion protein (MFP) family protein n=1 Tax=Vibrio ichthyoenteri ATCC 700023 TaxID=870968 RepID=F9S763_9VIBR|nr:HlyD family type I secretion periplasmic adaptor subunit [Vibrio ichthyoenteri]EGU31950.1 putative type I secretion protein, HlyD family [Vibrio ichthyoenteri ATCC 700023]